MQKEHKKILALELDSESHYKLKLIAAQNNSSMSELIRPLVLEFLTKEDLN